LIKIPSNVESVDRRRFEDAIDKFGGRSRC